MICRLAMLFNEGAGHHPPIPDNFPTCGDFNWDGQVVILISICIVHVVILTRMDRLWV